MNIFLLCVESGPSFCNHIGHIISMQLLISTFVGEGFVIFNMEDNVESLDKSKNCSIVVRKPFEIFIIFSKTRYKSLGTKFGHYDR